MKSPFLIALLILVFCSDLYPQNGSSRTLRAARTETPLIDGNPDEEAWLAAGEATDFFQYEPNEGKPSTEKTSVRVLYDDNYIYIGAWLYDSEPNRIVRKLARRDDEVEADAFAVMIDSYYDRKTAYVFSVNASGSVMDGVITNDGQGGFGGGRRRGSMSINKSWDAVWKAEIKMHDWGWSIEMQIPYSMLRFTEAENQLWGINFRRQISRKAEVADWVLIPRTVSGFVSRFGTLTGVSSIKPKRNIQFLPYALSKYETEAGVRSQFPRNASYNGGMDFKYGITNSLTLDATINPDFGQIEADPAELNLSTYETFFPERRQFFLEGVQIFDFNFGMGDGLLYTRRIGAQRPIIGALKLTGRNATGLSIGLLNAMTGNNWVAERNFAVARVKQEINSTSYIGSMVTSFSEFLTNEPLTQHWAGGVDWDLRFLNNEYSFAGEGIFSNRSVSEGRVTGGGGRMSFEKIAGISTFGTTLRVFSRDFNVNAVGRLRRADYITLNASFNHRFNNNESFGPFRRAGARAFTWSGWNYGGTFLGSNINSGANGEFNNFWNGNINFSVNNINAYDDRETRGNGLYRPRTSYNGKVEFSTDSRQKIVYQFETGFGRDVRSRQDMEIELGSSIKIGSGMQISGRLSFNRTDNSESWVRNVTFTNLGSGKWIMTRKEETFSLDFGTSAREIGFSNALKSAFPQITNNEYYSSIFTDRDSRQIDFTLRGDVIITRNLSFQFYAQTFFAKVNYDNYKILLKPDLFHEEIDYPFDEDFNRRSVNFNAVTRWEFLPGSSLYIVWSQSRYVSLSSFGPPELRGMSESFDIQPNNIFMIKLGYLLLP